MKTDSEDETKTKEILLHLALNLEDDLDFKVYPTAKSPT